MNDTRMSRRAALTGAAALGAAAFVPGISSAQQAGRAATLPARRDILIRGANVLTMDDKIPDLAVGDVLIRNGAIAEVGQKLAAKGAQVIDGRGMICMPGIIDTHWHFWTSMFRPYVRADINELGYFPVSNRLGQMMAPTDSYKSVRLGVAEAMSAGITTVHN